MKRAALVLLVTVTLFWLGSIPALGQRVQKGSVRGKKAPLSRAVRDLPKVPFNEVRPLKGRERRQIPLGARAIPPASPVDAAAQTEPGSSAPTIADPTFEGIGEGLVGYNVNVVPPDTDGEVGRTQYVQIVNSDFAVFDKATRTMLTGPTHTNELWSTLGTNHPCFTANDGDGIVVYDQFADRWVISQFTAAATGPWYECVAVSQTADATGQYFLYFFSYSLFPDYPKMGVWPDGYYVSYNMFTSPVGSFFSGKVCAFDRERMLNGLATLRGAAGPSGGGSLPAGNGQVCFRINDHLGMLPSDVDGSTPPPIGSPNYVMEWFNLSNLGIWEFHVDWDTPTNSTLNGVNWFTPDGPGAISSTLIPVTSFSLPCSGSRTCIPQQGTTQKLDSLVDVLMHRMPYRNFGTHEVLLTNHTVNVSGVASVRWYEIRNPGGTPDVVQTNSWSLADSTWRWMGSIAMDKFGNITLGYSRSGSSMKPSIAYATRLASDPLSTLGDEVTLFAGSGSQLPALPDFPNLNRWGDYTAMSVDPQDDCTFWYTNQYLPADGNFNWHTRIGSFKLAQCASEPFNLSVTPSTGSATTQAFSFLYSDTAGAAAITTAEGLFNTTAATASACGFRYNSAGNTIQLYQDDGIALSGAQTLGSAIVLANSQCSLNVQTSSAGTAGNHLVVNVNLTFVSPAFSGAKKVYMKVADSSVATGWEQKGTWTVP